MLVFYVFGYKKKKTRITTFEKAKLKQSDEHTNIDKYRARDWDMSLFFKTRLCTQKHKYLLKSVVNLNQVFYKNSNLNKS